MKKKIIFMVINMNVGGTERALLNMIADMPEDKYDITILMLEKCGGFLESIPVSVQVEYLEGYHEIKELLNSPVKRVIMKNFQKGKIVKGLRLLLIQIISKWTNNRSVFFKHLLKNTPSLQETYDIAVAYAGPMDFISYFVCHHITAKEKIQWIHFDVTKIGYDEQFAAKIYPEFNHIYVVSKEGKEKLIHQLPHVKDKIDYFPNKLSPEWIIQMAREGEGFKDDFDGIRILTVGRLSKEKGQDLIIPVLAALKKKGFPVRWYCIGEGNAREEYEQRIKEYNVEQDFILLGAAANPYPFMKMCDIYVQPSRHEGYCITLAEARCFTNPIISTNFTGAKEQLSHHKNGVIVAFDEQQILLAVMKILNEIHFNQRINQEGMIEITHV